MKKIEALAGLFVDALTILKLAASAPIDAVQHRFSASNIKNSEFSFMQSIQILKIWRQRATLTYCCNLNIPSWVSASFRKLNVVANQFYVEAASCQSLVRDLLQSESIRN